MQLDASRYRRKRLSLTSLIDVIFLLLLFFILSSTFTRFTEVEIVQAGSGPTAQQTLPDIVVQLKSGVWRVNGTHFDEQNVMPRLIELQNNGAASILLIVGEGVDTQTLVRSVEMIRRDTLLALSISQ